MTKTQLKDAIIIAIYGTSVTITIVEIAEYMLHNRKVNKTKAYLESLAQENQNK